MNHYIDIVGGIPQGGHRPIKTDRQSYLQVTTEGIRVSGNLPHNYYFAPKSKEDAQALIEYLHQWIENNV